MKFAQYLHDTQTPEWKRAYIDYRGLKKRITAIRRSQDSGLDLHEPPSAAGTNPVSNEPPPSDVHNVNQTLEAQPGSSFLIVPPTDTVSRSQKEGTSGFNAHRSPLSRRRLSTRSRRPSVAQQRAPSTKRSKGHSSIYGNGPQSRPTNPMTALPLHELLTQLAPQEIAFFACLDSQLEKVETFFSAREKELLLRTQLLQDQLRELRDHRKLVHKENDKTSSWTSAVATALKLKLTSHTVMEVSRSRRQINEDGAQGVPAGGMVSAENDNMRHSARSIAPSIDPPMGGQEGRQTDHHHVTSRRGIPITSDPDDYLYAKKKLKKAVLEHYRGLELLNNYRILNLTGFRKALKKFEKVTKIRAQEQYMTEKVDKSVIGSDKALRTMLREMQELYAQAFLRGNLKKALHRLRGGARSKTHHFSTFRTGFLVGTAVLALASGIYNSCLEKVHEEIPAWDALLFIYGLMSIPVFFSMLVGMNILVWARSRINYVFIFELDVRTRLDYREYFEIPSFLFATLCYAFWLSFARIGSMHVSPTTWPLLWLGLTAGILLNPFPILSRSSRVWLLRSVGKLFLSGTRRVEFTDFWLGDQFSSLAFTLSNLYMFGCIYVEGFQPDWHTCSSRSGYWPVAFVLASLPLFIRLVQSVKRRIDSGLVTHLINGGKYGSGVINYLFYYLWRNQETHYNPLFALWLICNTVYSTYATSWDLLMDWSLLRPHAKHFFLRDELGYSNHIYMYYGAIVTNVMIRFAWILYIPEKGPSMLIRTFVVGFLEMLRRVLWNFYRLENEHLGNMDQYRVTREVPLPYAFDEGQRGDQDDDGDTSGTQTPP